MYRNRTSSGFVLRHLKGFVTGQVYVSGITGDQQMPYASALPSSEPL